MKLPCVKQCSMRGSQFGSMLSVRRSPTMTLQYEKLAFYWSSYFDICFHQALTLGSETKPSSPLHQTVRISITGRPLP